MIIGKFVVLGILILLVITVTQSFTKHVLESQLTHGWNEGDWASFRLYKRAHNNPNLSISEYCNQRLAQHSYPNSGGMNCECVQKHKATVVLYNHVFRLGD